MRLAAADDRAAPQYVARIAAHGEYGLDALAALLGSARSSVVEAARQAIRSEIDGWPGLDPLVRQRRTLRSAQVLAAEVELFNPAAKCMASGFVVQILRTEHSASGAERQGIVAACEKVLRASVLERRQVLLVRRDRASLVDDQSEHVRYADDDAFVREHLKSAPGGGLPIGGVPGGSKLVDPLADGQPSEQSGERDPNAGGDEPGRLAAEAAANSGAQALQPTADDDPRLHPPDTAHARKTRRRETTRRTPCAGCTHCTRATCGFVPGLKKSWSGRVSTPCTWNWPGN